MTQKLFLLIFVFVCTACNAASLDHPLTISELVDIAMENNPETRIAWWNAKRAASALGMARSSYYPSLELDSFVKNGREFKFINGPDVNYTIIGTDLVLSLMLYDFGERKASVDAARNALIAANWQSNWTLQKVIVRVLENTYALIHAEELLKAAVLSRKDAEVMLNAASQLNAAGLAPITDVYTSRATLAQMKMEEEQQLGQLDIQKGKLIASLGLSPETKIEIAVCEQIPPLVNRCISDLIILANQQRADLMAKQARLSESIANQAKAKAAFQPKLSLTGTGGANHAIHDKTNAAQYQLLLNLNIPIFDGFNNFYQKRMAYDETRITKEELAQLELDIALEVLTYVRSLESAQGMLIFADENLVNAMKAYEGVLEMYRAGKERISEVSNAQRQLVMARIRYSDVKTRVMTSAANLAYATGTLCR